MNRITIEDLVQLAGFKVKIIEAPAKPSLTACMAMKQCHGENWIGANYETWKVKEESELADLVIRNCLNLGHHGVNEHSQIVFAIGFLPLSISNQLHRHRHFSFDVQSNRHTGKRFVEFVDGLEAFPQYSAFDSDNLEELFYFRPVGSYTDRKGTKYEYTTEQRNDDKAHAVKSCRMYAKKINNGHSPEHARDILPMSLRQHFIASGNLRTIFEMCDKRTPKDAQLEIQALCLMMLNELKKIAPEQVDFYKKNRYQKKAK